MFNDFTQVYLLYLFYGASFLFLGVSIVTKDTKGSDLKLAECLWLLAAFAFLHGSCEWLQLGHILDVQDQSPQTDSAVKQAMVCLSILSYIFLMQFGASLVARLEGKRLSFIRVVPAILLLAWAVYVACFGSLRALELDTPYLRAAKTAAKILFGVTGSILSAYGMSAYGKEIKRLDRTVALNLYCAGGAFACYGIFTAVPWKWHPLPELPVPAEVLRGIAAFFITCFSARALTVFDVEKRRKFENQTRRLVHSEKLASLGQLAAGIAHEINNPLAAASLGIQSLKRKAAERELVEKLDTVEKSIDRAAVIAQELLHVSRHNDSGFTHVDLNAVIRGALTLMRHRLGDYEVKEELGVVPPVNGDRGKLEQVFINIISNALEAMPRGGRISVSTAVKEGIVAARVHDSGVGIDPQHLARIFDPFFTTKEIGSGTGLGLYISYGIVTQHSGEIDVCSRSGEGTTLTVKLPAMPGAA